jgi:hypothetical protein
MSSLAARIATIQEQNVKKSSNLSRNWREGKEEEEERGWGRGRRGG